MHSSMVLRAHDFPVVKQMFKFQLVPPTFQVVQIPSCSWEFHSIWYGFGVGISCTFDVWQAAREAAIVAPYSSLKICQTSNFKRPVPTREDMFFLSTLYILTVYTHVDLFCNFVQGYTVYGMKDRFAYYVQLHVNLLTAFTFAQRQILVAEIFHQWGTLIHYVVPTPEQTSYDKFSPFKHVWTRSRPVYLVDSPGFGDGEHLHRTLGCNVLDKEWLCGCFVKIIGWESETRFFQTKGFPHIKSIQSLLMMGWKFVVLRSLISLGYLLAVSAHSGERDCSKRPATFSFNHDARTVKGDRESLQMVKPLVVQIRRQVAFADLWGKPIPNWSKMEVLFRWSFRAASFIQQFGSCCRSDALSPNTLLRAACS